MRHCKVCGHLAVHRIPAEGTGGQWLAQVLDCESCPDGKCDTRRQGR